MDDTDRLLDAARAAFDAHEWADARRAFLEARTQRDLSARDMEALAESAWWEGEIEEALSAFEETYRLYLQGDAPSPRPAALLALDISFSWFLRGDEALGSGWMSRAHRLLDGMPECVEHGYLRSVEIDMAIGEGRYDDAIVVARSITAMAQRFGDETLGALANVGEGIALVKRGDVEVGLRVLDEAMLPVVAGRVRPTYAGSIYCQLMSVCNELSDLRRAQQWTDATARWCEGFSSAVMFLGVCRVHRAQLLSVRGEWDEAEAEIALVREQLASMNVVAVGLALYELGEVRRMRGDLTGAEEAYGEAHRFGRDPFPGLALVRCAQGRHREALDALARAEATATDELARTRLWHAIAEVAVVAGDVDTAVKCADAIDKATSTFGSSGLLAAADLTRGRVQLARGDVVGAVARLEQARQRWHDLDAPLRVAETRLLLADAHAARGDQAAADRERSAAEEIQRVLGVVTPERAAVGGGHRRDGITPREAEVLALVAQGMRNREVAEVLVVSEKTVARHLANLYTKLGVSSRTAAAAYAHAQGLVPPSA